MMTRVAVAALRPHRADGPLRGRELSSACQNPTATTSAGWVFRNEKPGPGRFRQFMQFDADTVGTPGVAADAEMAMMMADVMEALGIKRGDYVIRVNNRKVLDGVLEAIGLGGDENAGRRLTVLRAIDKLDKFGPEGVRLLLGPGRWDGGKEGEGDFTKGAGLDDEQIARVLGYLNTSFRENRDDLANAGLQSAISNIRGEQTFRANRMSFGFWRDAVAGSSRGRRGRIRT